VISVTLHVAQQTHPLSANVRPHIYTFLVQIATLSERYVPILTRPLRLLFELFLHLSYFRTTRLKQSSGHKHEPFHGRAIFPDLNLGVS